MPGNPESASLRPRLRSPGDLPAGSGWCKDFGGETPFLMVERPGLRPDCFGRGCRQSPEATLPALCADSSGACGGGRSYTARLHSAHEGPLPSANVHVPAPAGVFLFLILFCGLMLTSREPQFSFREVIFS